MSHSQEKPAPGDQSAITEAQPSNDRAAETFTDSSASLAIVPIKSVRVEMPLADSSSADALAFESTCSEESDAAGANAAAGGGNRLVKWFKEPVESEIIWEGLASYGNYNLFAIEDMTKLYTSGVEYDRHSWGYFLHARMDYVAEILPFVLLVEPAVSDYYGNPATANRKLVPGLGITPIGLRMMWLNDKKIRPYMLVKGGMLGFPIKVLSKAASYEDFSLQSGFGVQTRLTRRVDLRLGLWGDFHFSNGYVVPSDPGTDVMNANWGISYHLGQARQ